MSTKHLDLGCGENPRNPYGQECLYGLDIADIDPNPNFTYKKM
jgi:hypothetical protein